MKSEPQKELLVTCYYPLKAYRLKGRKTKAGKSVIVFNIKDIGSDIPEIIELPCQQCVGCRIDRSKAWAIRCVHEKSLYERNCFITLTYNEENLDHFGSLVKSDFQKFMKRLRKHHKGFQEVISESGKITTPIRYFHCGEYGAKLKRPHHHACIFNFDFEDKKLWTVRQGVRLYRSEDLESKRLWPFGYATIGDVTIESAAYVARYITKKINGKEAEDHYKKVNKKTGEIVSIEPEYITMSRRPGIGKRWFDQFKRDLYPKDFVTHKGKKFKTPKYYDGIYDVIEPEKFQEIKEKRLDKIKKYQSNNTPSRLRVREKCQKARNKKLVREYEK